LHRYVAIKNERFIEEKVPDMGNQFRLSAAFSAVVLVSSGISGCGGGSSKPVNVVVPQTFTTIDGPVGSGTRINGISNNGAVVGTTSVFNGPSGPGIDPLPPSNSNFERSLTGTFTTLALGPTGIAYAINNSGTVVGEVNAGTAFSLTGTTLTSLTVPNPNLSSAAFGINDAGTIVGQDGVGTITSGFVDISNVVTSFVPTTGADIVYVQGVNNNGLAIGYFFTNGGAHPHGFTYDINTKAVTVLPDPSTPQIASGGLTGTQFLGLNDNGEAVGYYQTNSGNYGFLFNLSTNTYTYLDEPNAAIVGGEHVTEITGVNDSGEICGFYMDSGGATHGFIAV
jgi:hypothetical protein